MTELVSRDDAPTLAKAEAGEAPATVQPYARVRRRSRRWRGPIIFIVLPVLASILYSFVLATPMYVSQSLFAVRAADESAAGSKGGGLPVLGPIAAISVDGFALRDFMQSPDALAALNKDGDYVRRMAARSIDPFNTLSNKPSSSDLLFFYLRNIDVRFSMTEQILTLEMYAYSPADAQDSAKQLIAIAENFINSINERSRADALKLARSELSQAEERVKKATLALSEWRTRNADIDPTKSIDVTQIVIGQLRKNLADLQSEYASVSSRLAPQSQRQRDYESRIRAIQKQIDDEQSRLTGQKGSTADRIGEYQRLTVEQDFATRQLTSAQDSLEIARVNVTRQSKYLAVIVRPTLPFTPVSPQRVKIIAATLLASLLLYSVVSLLGRMAIDAMR